MVQLGKANNRRKDRNLLIDLGKVATLGASGEWRVPVKHGRELEKQARKRASFCTSTCVLPLSEERL